jgi:hypothetical protein
MKNGGKECYRLTQWLKQQIVRAQYIVLLMGSSSTNFVEE